jgi:primosomal protein N' (replication factor Y) (superfamily II helicase)
LYADIILPLALPKRTYTYEIPDTYTADIQVGMRVEVPFGKSKLYSGIVSRIHDEKPEYAIKEINSILDEVTVVSPQQLQLWDWIAAYYCCTLGEVMIAALPAHLKLQSETKLVLNTAYDEDIAELGADEYLIAEALSLQNELTVDDVRKILNKKTVFPVIQRLMNKGVLYAREDMEEKYKPKKLIAVRLQEPYRSDTTLLSKAFELLDKSEKQAEVLMAFMLFSKSQPFVRKQEILQRTGVTDSVLKSLQKKGILETYDREVSRISGYEDDLAEITELSDQQKTALTAINQQFKEKNAILLQGVTGSGKTRVYVELIKQTILEGGQVLYLLPEIGLTTQIINRLQKVFGGDVSVYHSKISSSERVELWHSAAQGKAVILGARSSLFLPFKKLDLIIIDEEHDSSFKQHDPAPRYNARDTALYLANLYKAKVLLGTATPSVETYQNAISGKFGLVEMKQRFGGLAMPQIKTINLKDLHNKKQMKSIFAPELLETLERALENGEQAILFQNRRGYAPIMECQTCGWAAQCKHCDVSLTYHKFTNRLRCHYCGYQIEPIVICPACESGKIVLQGMGTEKIEDELKLFLPKAKIGRMDLDTAGSKGKLMDILLDFEEKRIDILVGTQMVTKGLDFDNVAVVGVLGADSLVKFPDFRASERAFQLLTQVAGRAGRKKKQGLVLIQAFNPDHPVIKDVLADDFEGFINRELKERELFKYPPFNRLIAISLRHKDDKIVHQAAAQFAKMLRSKLKERVMGPVIPNIARIRGYFGQDILLKIEKSASVLADTKQLIRLSTEILNGKPGFGQVQVVVDVDVM